FTGNSSFNPPFSGMGGAVYCRSTLLEARDCPFDSNSSKWGGAIDLQSYSPSATLTHCAFFENHVPSEGGALSVQLVEDGTRHALDECLFAGNSSDVDGGALMCYGVVDVSSSTFVGNSALSRGGAHHLRSSSAATLRNVVAWGDSAPTGAELSVGTGSTGSWPQL